MRKLSFMIGIAAGIAVTAATVGTMYPDVSRRAMRDGRRLCKTGKRAIEKMF